jgi:hypothetical protein
VVIGLVWLGLVIYAIRCDTLLEIVANDDSNNNGVTLEHNNRLCLDGVLIAIKTIAVFHPSLPVDHLIVSTK